MSRHVARPESIPRRRQLVVVVGVLALSLGAGMAFGIATTSAALTDAAHLDAGTAGVGSSDPFSIVLVDAGTAHAAEPGAPLPLDVPGADALVPGRTVEATVRVANNHRAIAADLSITVGAVPVAGTPDITPHLRLTVLDPAGHVIVGDPAGTPESGAPFGTRVPLGRLAGRGAPPVADGAPWTPGADDSATSITVRVHLLDVPATSTLNGGRSRITVRFDATSTETTS
jgi:hypothetical protein